MVDTILLENLSFCEAHEITIFMQKNIPFVLVVNYTEQKEYIISIKTNETKSEFTIKYYQKIAQAYLEGMKRGRAIMKHEIEETLINTIKYLKE